MTRSPFETAVLHMLAGMDARLSRLESLVETRASESDIKELEQTIRYFGELLDQDKRERDLDYIRRDRRQGELP